MYRASVSWLLVQALEQYGGRYERHLVGAILRLVIPSNPALCIHARASTLKNVLLDDFHDRHQLLWREHHIELGEEHHAVAPYTMSAGYCYPFVHTTLHVDSEINRRVLHDPDSRGLHDYPQLFPVSMSNCRVGPFIADFLWGSLIVWNLIAVEFTHDAERNRTDCGHSHTPVNSLCSKCTVSRCLRCCKHVHGVLRPVWQQITDPLSTRTLLCSCGAPVDLVHTFHSVPIQPGSAWLLPVVHNAPPPLGVVLGVGS